MKKMIIFEPAMCCPTGVCGIQVDQELLRLSTIVANLKSNGITVQRYNLSNNPQIFIDNKIINKIINTSGVEELPVTLVDGVVVKTKEYPSNQEICEFLEISSDLLKSPKRQVLGDCCCTDGCC